MKNYLKIISICLIAISIYACGDKNNNSVVSPNTHTDSIELSYFSPQSAYQSDTITLYGKNMLIKDSLKVFLDSIETNIIYRNNDSLKIIVPEMRDGFYKIKLISGNDTLTYKNLFYILKSIDTKCIEISSFYPKSGFRFDAITLFGKNLLLSDTLKVFFGDKEAEITHKTNDSLNVIIPEIPAGDYTITVKSGMNSFIYNESFTLLQSLADFKLEDIKRFNINVINLYCEYEDETKNKYDSLYNFTFTFKNKELLELREKNDSLFYLLDYDGWAFATNLYLIYKSLNSSTIDFSIIGRYLVKIEGNIDNIEEFNYEIRLNQIEFTTMTDSSLVFILNKKDLEKSFLGLSFIYSYYYNIQTHCTDKHCRIVKVLPFTNDTRIEIELLK